jgi:hypothetical protein
LELPLVKRCSPRLSLQRLGLLGLLQPLRSLSANNKINRSLQKEFRLDPKSSKLHKAKNLIYSISLFLYVLPYSEEIRNTVIEEGDRTGSICNF